MKEHTKFPTELKGLIPHCTNLSVIIVLFYFIFVDKLLPKNKIGTQNTERSQLSVLDDFVFKISLCRSYDTVLNSA
jgi:hypothetical protein